MRQKIKSFGYLLLIGGLALIFTGFFLLVPDENRNEIFWLNLSVVCLVFLVFAVVEAGLFGVSLDFDREVAGLGIRLLFIRIYSLAAIAIVLIGYLAEIGFRYQFFFQLAAAFLLLIGSFLSFLSSGRAASVQAEQDQERRGKDEILGAIGQFEMLIALNSGKFVAEKQKLESLRETVRYLSPTNNPLAGELDAEIAGIIRQAVTVARGSEGSTAEVYALLNKCDELLKLRKNACSK